MIEIRIAIEIIPLPANELVIGGNSSANMMIAGIKLCKWWTDVRTAELGDAVGEKAPAKEERGG